MKLKAVLRFDLLLIYWALTTTTSAIADDLQCQSCHEQQQKDWQQSLHAHSVSPGLVGQLINYSENKIEACLRCHLPDTKNYSSFTISMLLEGHKAVDQNIHSVSCQGCHTVFGNIISEHSDNQQGNVHEIKNRDFFQSSLLCANCHQNSTLTTKGVPVTNTYREWYASEFRQNQVNCQTCHLPDGKHLFRGIHDKETVLSGLKINNDIINGIARLQVKSVAIGHAFPTYSIPRVILSIHARTTHDNPELVKIAESVIARQLKKSEDQWLEQFDTRLMPGEKHILQADISSFTEGQVVFRITVKPDAYYTETVYPELISKSDDEMVINTLSTAIKNGTNSIYILYESQADIP